MKPVIAMPQTGGDLFRRYMLSKYVQSLRRSGAEVRWIDTANMKEAISQMLACDGLLLPGGGDINPARYGQVPDKRCGKPNDQRDEAEWRMLEAFLPTKKPVLCICRGVQLLNVFFGGTLYQDIKKLQVCKHQDFKSKNKGCHPVRCFPHTKLGNLLGNEWITVNSMHHQAADRIGPGLTVAAISQDGFVEGLEILYHPFCVGVQWHPEHMSKRDPRQRKLFDAFVEACGKKT